MADQIEIYQIIAQVEWEPDPFIQVDAAGVALIYSDAGDGIRVDASAAALIYRDEEDPGAIQIQAAGAALVYSDVSEGGVRTFPLPNAKTVWQSQTGKRTFPLPGAQELE